jgi:hypothetical protein
MITRLFFTILTALPLLFVGTIGNASLRCESVFRLSAHTDSAAWAEQIVFSSRQMSLLFSRLEQITGTTSPAESLIQLKNKRPKDFSVLQKRIQLASETVEVLETGDEFAKINPRMKSLIFQDLTDSILALTEPHGLNSFLRPADALYFSDEYKTSDIFSMITAATEEKKSWHVEIDTRMLISNYMQQIIQRSLQSEKMFSHVYSDFVVLQMTYKRGAAGIEEMAKHCQALIKALDRYDFSLIMTVNDLPTDEVVNIRDNLDIHLQKLSALFSQTTSEQRSALQIDSLIAQLQAYQIQASAEISQYEIKAQEMLKISNLWEKITGQK